MKRLTRIEGVNRVVEMTSGETVATEEDLDTLPEAVKAGARLDLAVLEILTQYQWYYNGVQCQTRIADGSGQITLPDNLTYITFEQSSPILPQYLIPVGGYVYDKSNATNVLGTDATVTYSGKLFFEFEDLPAQFQFLAIAQVRKYIATGTSHISPARAAIEKDSWNDAFQACSKFDDMLSGGRARNWTPARAEHPHNQGFV